MARGSWDFKAQLLQALIEPHRDPEARKVPYHWTEFTIFRETPEEALKEAVEPYNPATWAALQANKEMVS